jgi:hypothetical protein
MDLSTGEITNVLGLTAISLVSLNSINQQPHIPTYWTNLMNYLFGSSSEQTASIAHLLYTDMAGNKLGYDNGVFYEQITGTGPMILAYDDENNNNLTESYYVPDTSIKMELYSNGSGTSEIDMGTPNGLIVANVTVSPTSVDEFKILNNGTGIYFDSENDTTQSLGLMLDVETPDYTQIVNASISQIEKGGSLNLSNNNGPISIQNNGLQRTGNLSLQQLTSTQNSSITINNIVIEADSTVNIVPSNWNDIGNSTVTINDFGSNGQTYYTEIITYKNGQVIQITFPSAALTIVKSADPTSYDTVGQTITYHYTVTNSGNTDISAPITVADDNAGAVPIQNNGILSPGSSVTGTTTHKITDADINAGTVTNATYVTGSFNNNPISSPLTVALVHYKQPIKKEEHNEEEHIGDRNNYGGPGYGGYGGAVVPLPMMSSNPMFSSVTDGIEYNYDAASYQPSINHIDTNVLPGGEIETTIVFFIKGKPNITSLKYTDHGQVLTPISHYDHTHE